jgi:hypothetical protein
MSLVSYLFGRFCTAIDGPFNLDIPPKIDHLALKSTHLFQSTAPTLIDHLALIDRPALIDHPALKSLIMFTTLLSSLHS